MTVGRIVISANELFVGDPDLPPHGTVVGGVPNGVFEILVEEKVVEGELWPAAVRMVFGGSPGGEVTQTKFSIDTQLLCFADPRSGSIPAGWWERRRARSQFRRRIMKGVEDLHYRESFVGQDGKPWAVVFRIYADGIYTLDLRSVGGVVRELSCRLM